MVDLHKHKLYHFVGFLLSRLLLFDFKLPHDVFSLFVEVDHDVADTQVGYDYGS